MTESRDPRGDGLFHVVVGDGRTLIDFTAFALLFSGGFALFLSLRREFLPHDVAFLGMTPEELCALADCRVVVFMFHDRVAFGGALIAIATLYLWITARPLGRGEVWAWWTLVVSGGIGFLSFLAYIGYGYLDTWHGVGTLFLLPAFAVGLARSRSLIHGRTKHAHDRVASRPEARGRDDSGSEAVAVEAPDSSGDWDLKRWRTSGGLGRWLILATGLGMVLAGLTILIVGMTTVFVPQDLDFMGVTAEELQAANPRLVPLIAHDRAGFGGGLTACGSVVIACALFARPSRSLWQALAVAGVAGFGAAIVVHLVVGYLSFSHLAPAFLGAALFATGLGMSRRPMMDGTVGRQRSTEPGSY